MARNGSGTYNRAVSPYTAGTTITAATVNSEMDDMAAALTQSLSRDGQSPPTANLPMGNFRITELANAIASTDAAPLGQVVAKAGDTMTGALGFAVGTAALPGVFVSGDTNTGFFQASAAPDTLSVSVGGVEVARFGTGGFMRLAAGTVAAPAYSFSGDTDTGIYNDSPNSLSVAVGGAQVASIGANNWYAIGASAQTESNFAQYNGGASASNVRALNFIGLNENFIGLTTIRSLINTDGSGNIEIYATPAGSRASDRRVLRATIPGAGAIALVGPVNVSSGDLDVAGNLRFNSGYGSAALAYGVRAWVNFNGTGTVAIRASGGVTSITDNGTGDYTVNLNFTMPDANYGFSINGAAGTSSFVGDVPAGGMTTTSFRINTRRVDTRALEDISIVSVTLVR